MMETRRKMKEVFSPDPSLHQNLDDAKEKSTLYIPPIPTILYLYVILRTIELLDYVKEYQRTTYVLLLFFVLLNVLLPMSYYRALPPLSISPVNSHTPVLVHQQYPFTCPKAMTNQAFKANDPKQPSLTSKKTLPLEPARPYSSPGVGSPDDDVECPKIRARSSSPTLISRESNQFAERTSSSASKDSAASWQGESPCGVCLCQPDPKVPRPRNAFILYRQHHQAVVVEQHPGLSNPEISKVIGDHWRASPPEIQKHWKDLAEQEKLRHQKQYPDYRYQPRRGGRSNSISTPNGDTENRKCPKCGGQSMTKSSGMMSAPGLPSPPGATSFVSPNQPPSTPSTNSSAHRFLNNSLASASFRPRPGESYSNDLTALQLASPRLKRPSPDSPRSPDDSKRFRTNSTHPSRAPNTPYPFLRRNQDSLPRPEFMPSQAKSGTTFTMGPPPRPHHSPASSLTLAPLHGSPTNLDSPASAQAKSLEAMVMSIPVLNKIHVLAQISPPLPPPGPTSPNLRTRGFVIAIDGPYSAQVTQITDTIFNALSLHHPVRIFRGPEPHSRSRGVYDFQAYLNSISQYHRLSPQVATYITTPASAPPPSQSPSSPSSPPASPKTIITAPKARTRSGSASKGPAPSVSAPQTNIPTGVPIALLPSFQLSHTDASASQIPITDAYAPADHWQWCATLWRGVVGPDVTIAMVPPGGSGTPIDGKAPGNWKGIGTGVDVRLDEARAMLVRGDGKGSLDGVLRRVGFEISEWIRAKEEERRGSH